jgi:hypothetical protein
VRIENIIGRRLCNRGMTPWLYFPKHVSIQELGSKCLCDSTRLYHPHSRISQTLKLANQSCNLRVFEIEPAKSHHIKEPSILPCKQVIDAKWKCMFQANSSWPRLLLLLIEYSLLFLLHHHHHRTFFHLLFKRRMKEADLLPTFATLFTSSQAPK